VSTVHVPEDETVEPGAYEFRVEADTADGRFQLAETIKVEGVEEADVEVTGGIAVSTSYPVLPGPSDATFEFSSTSEANRKKIRCSTC
jgi:hypothetical protein